MIEQLQHIKRPWLWIVCIVCLPWLVFRRDLQENKWKDILPWKEREREREREGGREREYNLAQLFVWTCKGGRAARISEVILFFSAAECWRQTPVLCWLFHWHAQRRSFPLLWKQRWAVFFTLNKWASSRHQFNSIHKLVDILVILFCTLFLLQLFLKVSSTLLQRIWILDLDLGSGSGS